MKQTITKSMFRDEFHRCGRGNQFSYEGLGELYDHLEALDDNYDLDVIALCCEYSEMPIVEALKEYDLESMDELRDSTLVVWDDGTDVLFAQF